MSKFMLRIVASNVQGFNPGDLLPDDTPIPVVITERIVVPDDTVPAVRVQAGVATVAGGAA